MVFVQTLSGSTLVLHGTPTQTQVRSFVEEREGIPVSEQVLRVGSSILSFEQQELFGADFCADSVIYVSLRLVGGKGGFGSQLRAAKNRVGQKKTENFSACRDLNGRRLRHVEAEKKLQDWELEERAISGPDLQRKYRNIKEGKPESSRPCKFGVDCKYKFKCRNSHPDDEERFASSSSSSSSSSRKEKSLSSSFGDPFDPYADDVLEEFDMAASVAAALGKKKEKKTNGDNKKRKRGSEQVANGKEEANDDDDDDDDDSTNNEQGSPSVKKVQLEVTASSSSSSSSSSSTSSSSSSSSPSSSNNDSLSTPSPEMETVPKVAVETFDAIDLSSYDSPTSLEDLGLDHLKAELTRVGLKCGGNLKQRAERLFLLKTSSLEDIPRKHRAKK